LDRGVYTRFYARTRRFSRPVDIWAHTEIATFTRLKSGSWRAQVGRKDRYISETFLRREDARQRATDAERATAIKMFDDLGVDFEKVVAG
jgi:hypothetical protein